MRSAAKTEPATAKNHKNEDEGAPVQYPLRAFIVTWTELEQWWTHYNFATLTTKTTDEKAATFLHMIEHRWLSPRPSEPH